MRIVVNDIAASEGGAISILQDFYAWILEHDSDNEWIFLLGDEHLTSLKNIRVIVLRQVKKSWFNRLHFDYLGGKKLIEHLKPNVVFSMQNTVIRGIKCRQVLYMQQSLPFQKEKKFSFYKKEERKLAAYQWLVGFMIKQSIPKADMTIVQTNWVREAVVLSTGISENRITVISPVQIQGFKEGHKDTPFDNHMFFYPTRDMISYKNHACIFEACKMLTEDFKFVLTVPEKVISIPGIVCVGNLTRDEVNEYYYKSTMVFPSYIETFGLPLAEARAVGTVILASDCAFSREILDGYENAYFFHPHKPEELARLMQQVMDGGIRKREVQQTAGQAGSPYEKMAKVLLKE